MVFIHPLPSQDGASWEIWVKVVDWLAANVSECEDVSACRVAFQGEFAAPWRKMSLKYDALRMKASIFAVVIRAVELAEGKGWKCYKAEGMNGAREMIIEVDDVLAVQLKLAVL